MVAGRRIFSFGRSSANPRPFLALPKADAAPMELENPRLSHFYKYFATPELESGTVPNRGQRVFPRGLPGAGRGYLVDGFCFTCKFRIMRRSFFLCLLLASAVPCLWA